MEGGNQKNQKIALLLSLNHMLGCSRCQWQVYMLFRSGQCKHFSRCSCTQDKWTVLSTCLVSIAEVFCLGWSAALNGIGKQTGMCGGRFTRHLASLNQFFVELGCWNKPICPVWNAKDFRNVLCSDYSLLKGFNGKRFELLQMVVSGSKINLKPY